MIEYDLPHGFARAHGAKMARFPFYPAMNRGAIFVGPLGDPGKISPQTTEGLLAQRFRRRPKIMVPR